MTAAILMMIGWLTLPGPDAAVASSSEAPCLGVAGPKPKVLVLGVFHIANLDYVKPDDRILVLFGSGHGPLLRHYLSESPRVELVDAATFLK